MSDRSQKEVNEIGFQALVNALGKEDAMRFIRQFESQGSNATAEAVGEARANDAAEPLPVLTPNEAHEVIRNLQDPAGQASFL